jgi:hypothetical protein
LVGAEVNTLSRVTVTSKFFQYKNATAYLSERFSDRLPGMDPMVCLQFLGQDFCVIRMGEIYGFPVFNHIDNPTVHMSPQTHYKHTMHKHAFRSQRDVPSLLLTAEAMAAVRVSSETANLL